MLTDFQHADLALAVNFWKSDNKISHCTSNTSLHYFVKCLCSKIAMT